MAAIFSLFRTPKPFFSVYSPPRPAVGICFIPFIYSSTTAALSFSSLPYGPSLKKGHCPFPSDYPPLSYASDDEKVAVLDESAFTRIFDVSALRVPSDICSTLESRLRGHLLNWPRVKNIARVPGDEIDAEFKHLLSPTDEDLVSLNRRIFGKAEGDGEPLNEVLYRDKLARTFNSRGYAKFRNLAKMSRPKRKRTKKMDDGEKRFMKGTVKNEVILVEVVEDEEENGDGEDLSRLLGEDVRRQPKWRGSTRLMLLDEQHANKMLDEMPQSIKAVFQEHNGHIELVKCKLTLFYSYWQLNEVLEELLPRGMIIPSAFETVGHIAHLNLSEEHHPYKKLIGKVFLDKNRPKIQTVVNKVDAIDNDYRTMQLEVLAGNNSLVTTVMENGLRFHVDLAAVYWNSRLSTERQRLISSFTHRDVVCDVFAGVGPIAISAAKKVKRVYANDLNPCAVEYLERNCVLNKLERRVEVFNMDGRRFIQTIFSSERTRPITQVVMNLPNDAAEFLDAFRGTFHGRRPNKAYDLPRLHVYGFSKAQDPEFDFDTRIRIAMLDAAFPIEMRRVRLVAPGKWMLCASFILPESVAFSKTVKD
ncbi:tRNA (guanine(37)-N1)-methyltransferase 1 isoform X2 [Andrographis paniculata]|uniref:tRNA (guanine(37)-N1)-methyltransferase 1 isoform X2 n=1 Tax=Andrographis paniculata TaxID=175694 RepID=UPI0021E8A99A|nr:tRNA (guanine(37)-N1)-methyltransferase 1 isoform X2 [Andrographis paniculata]